jgi:hypothetical protein
MANNFIHGKLSTINFNSQYFAGISIAYNEDLSDLTDITYTQISGATFAILLPGYNKATGTLTFVYDTLNQPTVAPNNLTPGTLINSFIISPDGTKLYTLTVYSAGLSWTGGPKSGPVMVTVPWQSTGPFTRPTS